MIDRTFTSSLNVQQRRTAPGPLLSGYARLDVVWVPALLVIHALLGVIISGSPLLATAHAGLVMLAGLWWALSSASLERVACLAAYATGAETLWRMTRAEIPWEFSKYAVTGILILGLLRAGRLRAPVLPLLFFILLLPSIILPMASVNGTELRNELSFNLSGPLALAVSAWFFSHVKLAPAQLPRVFLSAICPITSTGAIALYKIVTAKEIVFTHGSNPALSGGFGPAQVSAALGLGALMSFLWAMDKTVSRQMRLILLALTLYLLGQSALTFSRGGLYMACGGALLAAFFLVKDRKTRMRLFIIAILLGAAVNFVALPRLDEFTGGKLARRIQDTSLTGRDNIAAGDLRVFADHPLFGVGPGQTQYFRDQYGSYSRAHAHSEFSRLLSEHGVFGMAAILILLVLSIQHFLRARSPQGRALVASMIAWSFLFMLSLAMRLAAPSFVFGMTAATISQENGRENEQENGQEKV
ncbi:MAG: O-antigen ligase family protein [Blastocatellia bacterium]